MRPFNLLLLLSALSIVACTKSLDKSSVGINVDYDGRIIGGAAANGGESFAGKVVALGYDNENNLCSGVIYSESVIVTSASCVLFKVPAKLKVYFGLDVSDKSKVVERQVLTYRLHPDFSESDTEKKVIPDSYLSHNIAVVKFSGGLPAGYRPAKLVSSHDVVFSAKSILLTGYGKAVRPRVEEAGERNGIGVLRSFSISSARFERPEDPNAEVTHFYYSGEVVDRGISGGDEGGGGFVVEDGEWVLWGVLSTAWWNEDRTWSTGFSHTSVVHWQDWIETTSAELEKQSAAPSAGTEVEEWSEIARSVVFVRKGNRFCSGLLLSERIVLSSAYCVRDIVNGAKVGFGPNLKSQDSIPVQEWQIHPGFGRDGQNGNVDNLALLKLERSAPDGFVPARILEDDSHLKGGASVILAGFALSEVERVKGNSNLRQEVSVVLVPNPPGAPSLVAVDRWFGVDENKDQSGSALISVEGELFFWGIASWHNDEATSGYTKIAPYRSWIERTSAELLASRHSISNPTASGDAGLQP